MKHIIDNVRGFQKVRHVVGGHDVHLAIKDGWRVLEVTLQRSLHEHRYHVRLVSLKHPESSIIVSPVEFPESEGVNFNKGTTAKR